MSHPIPSRDYSERHEEESEREYAKRSGKRVMSPLVHRSKEFKEARKAFQGINATREGSISKSKSRHAAKLRSKALRNKHASSEPY